MSEFPQIVVDNSLKIVRINSSARIIINNSTNRSIVAGVSVERIFPSEEFQRVSLLVEVATALNKQDNFEAKIITSNGSLLPVFIIIEPSQLDKQEIIVWIIPKSQGKALSQENDIAEAGRLALIGRMVFKTTHDLNNMVNIIGGYAECIKHLVESEPSIAGKALNHFRRIADASEKSKRMLQNLISLAQGGSKEKRSFNIHFTVHRMVDLVKGIANRDITIKSSFEACDPLITGTESDIEDIIINLVTNAVDAMVSKGTILISTSTVNIPGSGTFLALSVKDSGVGMTESTQSKLFEPFFTTKGSVHGNGLGLYGVKETVYAMGGFIDVKSRPAMGTEFIVYLPSTNQPEQLASYSLKSEAQENSINSVFSY